MILIPRFCMAMCFFPFAALASLTSGVNAHCLRTSIIVPLKENMILK